MIVGRESNTYWAKAQLAQDADLLALVVVAMLDVADEVSNEDPATLTPPPGFQPTDATNRKQNWHDIRANLARDMFKAPSQYVSAFALGCVNRVNFNPLDAGNMKASCRFVFVAMCGV